MRNNDINVPSHQQDTDRKTHIVTSHRSTTPKNKSIRSERADLRAGLLLLLLPQSGQTDAGDLDDLEADTGNITLGLALATETGEEDFVVLVDEVQATVIGD